MPASRRILSETEKIIIRHICDQKTSKEIAPLIGMTPRTVDSYRKDIMMKTDSVTVAGLVIHAIQNKIYEI